MGSVEWDSGGAGGDGNVRGSTVLVVADSFDCTESLRRLLRSSGTFVTVARTIHEAQRQIGGLSTQRFDCVVLDVRLPDGLGTSLLESLDRLSPRPAIVVCTASFDEVISLAALFYGAVAFSKDGGDLDALSRLIVGACAAHAPSMDAERAACLDGALVRVCARAGLTPSESKLLRLLVLGGEAQEIALHCHVTASHSRNMIRTVLSKCGAESACDLALVVYGEMSQVQDQAIPLGREISAPRTESSVTMKIDPDSGALNGPEGNVALTGKELELLQYLKERPSGTHPRQIASDLFNRADALGRGRDLVYVHLSNLRKKLRMVGFDREVIEKTRRGYKIRVG